MMEGLKITGVTLTAKAASDVLQTGVDAGHTHGFGYWGKVLDHREGHITIDGNSSRDKHLMMLRIQDVESSKVFRLDLDRVGSAVAKMLRDPKGTDSVGWTARLFDSDGLDGPLADAIIQVACFGKIIYG